MSVLSLKTPVVIITYGLPGSGKTFFATQFADTFKLPMASYNSTYSKLFADASLDDQKHESVTNMVGHQLSELLKTKHIVIVDGVAHTAEARQNLIQQAKSNGYDHLIVWVQTDPTTAKKRSLRRTQRDPDFHLPALNDSHFKALLDITEPLRKENYVVISGKHNFTTQARMVLRKLAQPRAAEADKAYRQSLSNSRRVNINSVQG